MEYAAAVAVIDALGRVAGWSEGARMLTGHPAQEVVGKPAADLLADEVPAHVLAARSGTVALRHADGRRVEFVLTACPVPGPEGETVGHLLTADPPWSADPTLAGQAFQQASIPMSVFDVHQRHLCSNEAAHQVMGAPEKALPEGFFLDTVEDASRSEGFVRHLRQVVETGRPVRYESFTGALALDRERAWSVEMWPLRDPAGELTAVALGAIDSTEQYLARLRLALIDEAATSIGTTLDVVRTSEELVEILVPGCADFVSVDLLDWVLGAEEPPVFPEGDIVLRRVAHGSTTEGTPEAAVRLGETEVYEAASPPARALREGRTVRSQGGEPELLCLAEERDARSPEGRRYRKGVHSVIAVPLQARGVTLGVAVGVRMRHPEAYAYDDAVFAEEVVSRAAVCIDNARRFARERSTALALQRSLLPGGLPGQAAVEVAHRYLPSGSLAGIGGDWFDVIPLSGSRVGLVVGDVVGHGIRSSATMGRLRTAVRTLADVDLPPDELLTHLDDLVTHLAAEGTNGTGEEVAELGATCLYAVYDPVSRHLVLAAAGHPPPAVVLPGGEAELIPMTAGPPLGVGGLPFEAAELQLPEGAVVALYTDGLIEDRDRDVDRATEEMCRALSAPADSLEALSDNVLKAVLPEQPCDDVALLIARTRALGADRVATWDVPPDPAQVAHFRQAATERLTDWGLDEAAFVTELVVSELVTNAIRYGEPPITLRLIRDRALICEVADGSSTSPHLRRAHAYDEGGRGLLLVAQLTQRWGSRQTGSGKTIWCEQPLPEDADQASAPASPQACWTVPSGPSFTSTTSSRTRRTADVTCPEQDENPGRKSVQRTESTIMSHSKDRSFGDKPVYKELRVPTAAGELYVRDYAGDGPAFVMLHGFPDNLGIFDKIAPLVAESGRRVVVFDFLGFGDSDKPGAGYSFDQQAGDVLAVADALHFDRIIPVGHDAGGAVAVNFALSHPERTAEVALLNCFYGSSPSLRFPELILFFATPELSALSQHFLHSPAHFEQILEFQRTQFREILGTEEQIDDEFLARLIDENFSRQGSGPAFAHMTAQLLSEVAREDQKMAALEQLDIPFRLIWGAEDPYLSPAVAEEIAKHLRNATLTVLAGGGHWPQLDRPAEVTRALLSDADSSK